MFARLESWGHRLRWRLSRSEWAIRNLGLVPAEGASEAPGLLLIQIDGLSRPQLEAAMAAGRMPFLRRLLQRDAHELHTFYPGLPTSTPAVQAELYYGVRSAVPAFSFLDRARNAIGRMWDPEWAKAREAACAETGEGLLRGGSSWSNIYTGGASPEESHFCAASIGLGDMWRTGKIRNILVFLVLQLPAAVRILWLLLVELGVAARDAAVAIAHGRKPALELLLVLSRVFVGVGLRELLTISGGIDVTRGLPIVHLNFVGYDEKAHQRGPASGSAHAGLRGIDHAIRKVVRAAHRSRRRDYETWIFSDHGQETTRAFPPGDPGGIEEVIARALETVPARDPAWRGRRPQETSAPMSSLSRRRHRRLGAAAGAEPPVLADDRPFAVAAMGPVGHVYFAQPMTDEQRHALARRLVQQERVPGVLLRTTSGKITWLHSRGETHVPDGVPDALPHPPAIRAAIAEDLVLLCAHPDAGDLILLGWSPWDGAWSFAPERGAHGGFGPNETQGFLLLPARTPLPAGTRHFVRPDALRAAARHYLGRAALPPKGAGEMPTGKLRLMTYNVHSCAGMDGRVSPRRIARVIAAQTPDLVALQEIDLGRRRSRAEDQAALIARQLGMQVVFCPTITRGEEHYGHALLSRWPIEVVKRALLPHDAKGWWNEPRSALWARVLVAGTPIHVVTTHLGLGPRERLLQMKMLLGEHWLGGVPKDERILFCGDFNLTPGSAPYKLAGRLLRDVQDPRHVARALNTFSSTQPLLRLDHVFVSAHFAVENVAVPRNLLTRVASDHLPLLVDLTFAAAAAGTTTGTSPSARPHKP